MGRPKTNFILHVNTRGSRVYALAKLSLPQVSRGRRRKVLEKVVQESGLIAVIEWWTKGSIVAKPKSDFLGILVFSNAP